MATTCILFIAEDNLIQLFGVIVAQYILNMIYQFRGADRPLFGSIMEILHKYLREIAMQAVNFKKFLNHQSKSWLQA